MRKTRERLGRGSILFAVTSLLLSTSAVIPAQAVNKAGAACTKLNSKAKIGKESFVCAKNPIAKSTKRIWVWADCLVANKSYIDGLASQKNLRQLQRKQFPY